MKRLSAFIGRSFIKEDEALWLSIRKHLDSLKKIGFIWEDAEERQMRPISDKVKERIQRNDIFIGLLTKRAPIGKPIYSIAKKYSFVKTIDWLTSYWVIQESGYAIGQDKKVLFLIEKGLTVPSALNADFEYIEVDRDNPTFSSADINQMIISEIGKDNQPLETNHAIRGEVTISTKSESLDVKEITEEEEKKKAQDTIVEDYFAMLKAIKVNDYSKAENLFNNLMNTGDNDDKLFYQVTYYSNLYRSGQSEAIEKLKQFVDKHSDYHYGIESLARCYMFYDDDDKAEKEVEKYKLATNTDSLKKSLSILLSEINLKQKKYDKAIDNLYPFMDKTSDNSDASNFELYKILGDIYKAQKKLNISCALYDMALNYKPTDTLVRFRAAFDYDDITKHSLSLYHYKAHLKSESGVHVLNNMGIEYHQLNLLGKQVEAFKKAIEKGETLANSNLARIYINNGLYDEAGLILNKATEIKDYHGNVDHYSNKLKESINKEDVKEESILESAKEYRKHIHEFASAISVKFDKFDEFNGLWLTNHSEIKEISIQFLPTMLLEGKHEIEYKVPPRAIRSSGLLGLQALETRKNQFTLKER